MERGPVSAADALTLKRDEFVADALCSVPWYRDPPTSLTMPCGCSWGLVERADEGGKWVEDEWTSCADCAVILEKDVKPLEREGWALILGWLLALCVIAPLLVVALVYVIRWWIS